MFVRLSAAMTITKTCSWQPAKHPACAAMPQKQFYLTAMTPSQSAAIRAMVTNPKFVDLKISRLCENCWDEEVRKIIILPHQHIFLAGIHISIVNYLSDSLSQLWRETATCIQLSYNKSKHGRFDLCSKDIIKRRKQLT